MCAAAFFCKEMCMQPKNSNASNKSEKYLGSSFVMQLSSTSTQFSHENKAVVPKLVCITRTESVLSGVRYLAM